MDPIVEDELGLLERVRRLLEESPEGPPPKEAEIVAELIRLRDEIPCAKDEDRGPLLNQYHQNVSLLEQMRAARDAPTVNPESPYFAHLRLKEGARERDVCLGKATRLAPGVRIVDWRNAPVSRLYYRYQQGEEYEETFGGRTVVGEVKARRTVTIRGGELERVEAPEGVFVREADGWHEHDQEPPRLLGGEGAALRAHGVGTGRDRRLGTDLDGRHQRVDKRLPDIAGLLDPEQFELITQPSSGFVVIRGMAGSGKTTVALHRIAWLAYDDPQINSGRTLFLVFSPGLRDYVSHVLPALEVPRAKVHTFRHWASGQRQRHFSRLPRQLRDDTPALVQRLKLHPAVMHALEDQVREVKGPATAEQALDDWASIMVRPDGIRAALDEMGSDAFSEAELEKATTWCRDRHQELVAWLEGDKEAPAELDEEDDALLLRAWQLRVGPLRGKRGPLRYRHVAVDEVQDFSPLEVRVLLDCLDVHQSITLAGDTQQHVMLDAGFTSWADFFRHLGVEGQTVNTLRVSYRCARPVMSFAMSVLGELQEDEEPPRVTRDGPEVELFRFTDHGACVEFLARALEELVREEPFASVAVLTPTSGVSRLYHQGLEQAEVPRLRRVENQRFTFQPGIEVTEVEQVKGLEFDYVILVEVSASHYPDSSAARRKLHVGATRAVHQLWLTTVGTSSPLVRDALS